MNYEEVIDKIENSRRFENRPGVEITNIMLEKLGYPQSGIPYVHVAGTNGKGSVSAFLAAILKEAGLKVGTFTSPHLIDFEERIVVDGQQITKEDVQRLGELLINTSFGVVPTMFDYCVAMAMLYFKEQKVDIMIIETGLGGRLDSTNAIGIPEVAVITKIGYDHVAILGDDIAQIAGEKAGIIKAGSKVVLEQQEERAMGVLLDTIMGQNVKDYAVTDADLIEKISKYPLKIKGVHQYENAAAASLAAQYIIGMDKELLIERGLSKAVWPGRMEVLLEEPFFMVDGAHNGHGVAALKESLIKLYPGEKFRFFMGVMADKDYPRMIEQMLDIADEFITVTPDSSRALDAKELREFIEEKGVKARSVSTIEQMLEMLGPGRNIAFGSLYFIGDIKGRTPINI